MRDKSPERNRKRDRIERDFDDGRFDSQEKMRGERVSRGRGGRDAHARSRNEEPTRSRIDDGYEDFDAEDEIEDDERTFSRGGRIEARKRKKRKKKHYLLKFLLVAAVGVGAYFLMMSDLFSIRAVEVAGNEHYTKERIAEMSGLRIGENMFKIDMGKVEDRLAKDPYIQIAKVERKPFHGVLIDVEERAEKFMIKNGEKYAIVDYDGMVLREADEPPPLPLIENFKITKAEPGKALVVTENALLMDTIRFLGKAEKSDLFFMRVVASDISVKAFIYEGLICKGSYKNIESNIESLKKVIADLQQQNVERGTIIISGNDACTFTPEADA
ncbi:MAG: FtsQ-type POTRA domain-containing protein [Clostridiales Family XIII bacterium]|jgi:cell division protein FtsQ|nr:FtsQ-type POTRA domain-containing protein [Clostridiales Family XIII bacterium]